MEKHMKGLYRFSLALLIASAGSVASAASVPTLSVAASGNSQLVAANEDNSGAGNGNYTEGVERRVDRRMDRRTDRRENAAGAVGAPGADTGIERRDDRRENRRIERRTGGAAPVQQPGSSPSPQSP
jgi:hypothetical protein